MDEVQKNVRTFLEIVRIGKSSSVIHWDESNFKRAWRWAQYAEEVHNKLKSKPHLVQAVTEHINQAQKLDSCIFVDFNFKDLQHASGKLRLVLLNNPHLSSAQFSYVLDMYEVDFYTPFNCMHGLENLISDSYHTSCVKGTFYCLSNLKKALCNSMEQSQQDGEERRRITDVCYNSCSKALLNHLQILIGRHKGNDSVIKKLNSVASSCENGMEIILRLSVFLMEDQLPLDLCTSNETVLEELKYEVLQWILKCSKHEGAVNYEKIWSCPSNLLCKMSFTEKSFFDSYLCCLRLRGERLVGIRSIPDQDIDEETVGSSYRDLIDKFRELKGGPGDISKLCEHTLKSWCLESDDYVSRTEIPNNCHKLTTHLWRRVWQDAFSV